MTVTEKQRQNLVPLASRSPAERKAICQKGAEGATAVKNRKKTLRELIEQLGNSKITQTEKEMFQRLFPGCDPEEVTKDMMLVASAYNQAISRGNTKAMSFIRDTKGEKPETTISGNFVSEKIFITPEEQKAVEEHIAEVLDDSSDTD